MRLQSILKFHISKLNNFSIKHVNSLHNFKSSKTVLVPCPFSNIYFSPHYSPTNLSNVNKFSTTNTLSRVKAQTKGNKKSQSTHVDLQELDEVINVKNMMSQFNKAIEDFKDDMVKHTGLRTSMGAIEELTVNFDDNEYKLQELVEISRKPKLIVLDVSAFPQVIPNIISTLSKTQMNLNPQQEGTTLYITIPKVTREHREQLAKSAKVYFVKCKDNITDIRNKHVRAVRKKSSLAEDLAFRAENYISIISRQHVQKAEELLNTKQKDLLGVPE